MPRFKTDSDPSIAAEVVREWLGITDNQQLGWANDREALRSWREAMEDHGILVFLLEMGADEVRGFSAWDNQAPLIVANSSRVSPAARIFTLVHELGHLCTRVESVCVDQVYSPALITSSEIERWCERFGAALIMPISLVRNLTSQFDGKTGVDEVRVIASNLRVSHRAAALRLIDLGYAPYSLYEVVDQVFAPAPDRPSSVTDFRRPSRSISRPREYGIRTIRTILNSLPPRDALSVLRMKVDDVRRLAEGVPDVRVP